MSASGIFHGDLAAFRKAVATNTKELIEKHLSHMKNLSQEDLNQALFTCIQNFKTEQQTEQCLFLLLRYKANPNCQIDKQTPLIAACKIAQNSLVKSLLENGAKADLCNSEGKHPLQFVLSSRKQNYDVAESLITCMSTANIEIGTDSALVVAVEKEFQKIFKMLVEKGASLMLSNQDSIFHVIMKRKFKDNNKKKKMLKELANRWQLSQVRDKSGKLPIEYEVDNDIKTYFMELFKPKVRTQPEKDHHKKDNSSPHHLSKEKQIKKKPKEEQQIVPEEEGVEQFQNDEEGFSAELAEENKEKIVVELVQEEEEDKKVEEDKEKLKKTASKILTPNAALNKKVTPKLSFKNNQKSGLQQKSVVSDKEKGKKVVFDKKKKQPQPSQKKNKSFSTLVKKVEVEQQKKEEDKKKISSRRSSQRQEDSKKIVRKESDAKLQLSDLKIEQQNVVKIEQSRITEDSVVINEFSQIKILSPAQIDQIQQVMTLMAEAVSQVCQNIIQISSIQQLESDDQQIVSPAQDLQNELTVEIIKYLMVQEQKYKESQPCVNEIITFLQNKMKLCIQSHNQHPFNLKIAVYGSQATALCIGQSDLDLLVITSQNPTELISMFETYQIFIEEEIIQVKFIKAASMPVIKLVMNQTYDNYKVDITFQLRCAQLIQEFKAAQPLLKPLVIILKQIIYAYKLADPYTGGLGSYSLTLMVIALLQFTEIEKTKQNLGSLFLQFLLFYGFQINYVCQAIIVHPPIIGFDYKPFYSIYQLPNTMDLTPKLVIYDPMNPVNNVGRTTYRISNIKTLFKVIYLRLKIDSLKIADILKPEFLDLIQETF